MGVSNSSDSNDSPLVKLFAKHMDIILRQLELLGPDGVKGIAASQDSSEALVPVPAKEAKAVLPRGSSKGKIAVIGMAARLPGAQNVSEFWQNLNAGVESISTFEAREIDEAVPRADRENPNYGRSRGILSDADKFDAAFFRISPREAKVIDPQQRIFLELAYQALEDAAYDPERFPGEIGVFAGVGDNFYHINNVLDKKDLIKQVGSLSTTVGNMKDYVATRVSYKLNLRGPSISLNTACSTSLVAVDQAVWSLRNGHCSMALAGAATIYVPQKAGFMHGPGLPFSSDGHVRPFSSDATGVLFSDGAGVVVLKRLEDAERDGDHIYGVIIGSAVNNDGAEKVSFFAPSVSGQARVITKALEDAGVSASTLSFIEAHATGTLLGDPVEFEGLKAAFAPYTDKKGFCALGAFKGNIGHTDSAAGITGLIKALLSLKNRRLPASINFTSPNPAIDFSHSPFYIPKKAVQLKSVDHPLRAGISAFGFGGTNCHVIVEEAPPRTSATSRFPQEILLLSAETPEALARAKHDLSLHLQRETSLRLSEVAYTLALGRKSFSYRSFVVAGDSQEARAALDRESSPHELARGVPTRVAFIFPGQGIQSINMGRDLYESLPSFRRCVDSCAEILSPELGLDIRKLIFPQLDLDAASAQLEQTEFAQAAIFTIEYALAQFLLSIGIKPEAMIGHSLGELVCAVISGVLSINDALFLVARRGKLMQTMQPGGMVSVSLSETEAQPFLGSELQVAAVNGPRQCVVSGTHAALAAAQKQWEAAGIASKALQTSHAFHSHTVDAIVPAFIEAFKDIELKAPQIPFVSSLTGDWIKIEQATSPRYWAEHMRYPVRFYQALKCLWAKAPYHLIESGPRHTASMLARKVAPDSRAYKATPLLGGEGDFASFLSAIGQIWANGIELDWAQFFAGERRLRVSLPPYSFERVSHWLDSIPADQRLTPAVSAQKSLPPSEVVPQLSKASIHNSPESNLQAPTDSNLSFEETLRSLLLELSGITIPPHARAASFLDLGFDSLTLTQVAARLKKDYGSEIGSTQLLLTVNTLQKLAAFVGGTEKKSHSETLSSARRHPVLEARHETYAEASFSQKRMWMHAQVKPKSTTYNIPIYFEIEGLLDRQRLREVLALVCARHDILNTSYHLKGPTVYQKVEAPRPPLLKETDLSGLRPDEAEIELEKLLAIDGRPTFDLLTGPVLRFGLYKFSESRHMFLIVAHHIAFDLLSIRLFLHELTATYANPKLGLRPKDEMQYIDFSHWQRAWFAAGEFERQLEFWRKHLGSSPLPILSLALDSPRPKLQPEVDAVYTFSLDKAPIQALFDLARREGATPFMLILAAYKTLLLRLAKQDEIVIGTTIASRPVPETEHMLGFFANTLALRSRLAKDSSFITLLRSVRDSALGAFDHPDMPLDELMKHLVVDRNPRINPVFQSFFCFEKVKSETYPMGPLQLHFKGDVSRAAPATDINLWVEEHADHLRCDVEFSQQLFRPETIRSYFQHFERLLLRLAADPGTRVNDIEMNLHTEATELEAVNNQESAFLAICRDIMGLHRIDLQKNFQHHGGHSLIALRLSERLAEVYGTSLSIKDILNASSLKAILVEAQKGSPALTDTKVSAKALSDATPTPTTAHAKRELRSIHGLFSAVAKSSPENLAIRYRQRSISYGKLEEQSTQFACYLRSRGIKTGSIVGIAMDRSIDLIVAMLGILKSGAAYLPMDPAYPNDRLVYMAENAGLSWIVTEEEYAETLAMPSSVSMIEVDSERRRIENTPSVDLGDKLNEESLAYVIYTSGSTGKPKGVQIPHSAATHFLEAMREAIAFAPSDKLMGLTTISFDISVLEIFLTLTSGAALILLDSDDALDGKKLAETMVREEVSVFQATPSGWRVLLNSGWTGSPGLKGLCGGEAFPRDLAASLLPRVGTLYNVYGPTEATVWATYSHVKVVADHKYIGRPLRGYRTYILDDNLRPAAARVAGGLFIAGPALALGYLKRPDLTAERFVADPFYPGERMYNTGDQALLAEDGRIEFLGRADDQVKIRGYRIELGEIESVANLFASVRLSAAVVHEFGPGDQRIVLFVEQQMAQKFDLNELKHFMQQSLPSYFMPNFIWTIASIPLTNNGKIDRKRLKEICREEQSGSAESVPNSDSSAWLMELWARHLKIQSFPPTSNFFEVGGYSMLAILVAREMSERTGLDFSLTDLLASSFEQLVKLMDEKEKCA